MAEVLPPIVQSSSTMTMLHTPPDAFQTGNPQSSHSSSRMAQIPRSHMFNNNNGGMPYRGTPSTPAYAFQATPTLTQVTQAARFMSTLHHPSLSTTTANHATYPSSSSASTASSSSSNPSQHGYYTLSKDDSVLSSRKQLQFDHRPASNLAASSSTPDLLLRSSDAPVKPSPDRYRRVQRRAESSPSTTALQSLEAPAASRHSLAISPDQLAKHVAFLGGEIPTHRRAGSADDSVIGRSEGLSRYRRRSVGSLEPSTFAGPLTVPALAPTPTPTPTQTQIPTQTPISLPPPVAQPSWAQVVAGRTGGQNARPANPLPSTTSLHHRQNSPDKVPSATIAKRPSSARQNSSNVQKPAQPNRPTTSPQPSSNRQEHRVAGSSPRANADSNKRLAAPSPLSKPVTAEPDSQKTSPLTAKASVSPIPPAPEGASLAVQQLHAVADKEPTKTVKSRLRRAFSFGSSQELKKASGESTTPADRAKLKKEKVDDECDAEEAAIIAKQEAAGLGAGIYSNQGQAFTGSTDNISLASTASSASLMLRKMGRGMRKSTRSLKGLFRPKSVVGVPAAEGPVSAPTASTAEVSLVTVEAETRVASVNADSQTKLEGEVRISRFEHNSVETSSRTGTPEKPDSSHEDGETWTRRSVFGGDRERAEVLAAVRKGILKRKQFNWWPLACCSSLKNRIRHQLRHILACRWSI